MGWNKVYILIMGSIRSFDGRNCEWLSKGEVRWSIRRFRRWSIQLDFVGSLKGGCFSLVAEIAMRGRYEWSVSFGRRAIGGRAAGRFVECEFLYKI